MTVVMLRKSQSEAKSEEQKINERTLILHFQSSKELIAELNSQVKTLFNRENKLRDSFLTYQQEQEERHKSDMVAWELREREAREECAALRAELEVFRNARPPH